MAVVAWTIVRLAFHRRVTITVDTSAVIAVAADEPSKPALVEAVRGADLIAPASLAAEVGNALSAMLKRKRITLADARAVLKAFQRIPIQTVDLDLSRAVKLSAQLDIYAYDAFVIACAQNSDTPLLSLDGRQREAARRVGVTLIELNPG